MAQEKSGRPMSAARQTRSRRLFKSLINSRALHVLESERLLENAESSIARLCMTLSTMVEETSGSVDGLGPNAVNYDQFCTLGMDIVDNEDVGGLSFQQYFSPSVFVQLADPADHLLGIGEFQDYMVEHQRCLYATVLLSKIMSQEKSASGQVSEEELETFVATYLAQDHHSGPIPFDIQEELVPFYRLMVVRRFFFFLDPNRTGFLTLQTLLSSNELSLFLESQYPQDFHYMMAEEEHSSDVQTAMTEFGARNAFVPDRLLELYHLFVDVDRDKNGTVSEEEMAAFDHQMLSPIFLKHLFQETLTFEGEDGYQMDFRGFLDFAMATQNTSATASLKYYWRVLDFEKVGYLNRFQVAYFMKDILQICEAAEVETAPLEVVVDNIWDLAQPTAQDRIIFSDLKNSQQGGLFVAVLSSATQFINYDRRET